MKIINWLIHKNNDQQPSEENDEKDAEILHPFTMQDDSLVDNYLLGLLFLFEAGRIEYKGIQFSNLAEALGVTGKRLDELLEVASLYDEQAKHEHFDNLPSWLSSSPGKYSILCDLACFRMKEEQVDGAFLKFWRHACLDILHLDEDEAVALENLCFRMSLGIQQMRREDFGSIPDSVLEYYLPTPVTPGKYLVIDLSGGALAIQYSLRYSETPPDPSSNICSTSEIWLRRIPKGSFMMGSPEEELGRWDIEIQHRVNLTEDFYIGVFPVTQRQWELIMGNNPAKFNVSGASAPVEQVSYNMICGGRRRSPDDTTVTSSSFLGVLRQKTGLNGFDLPTEAQWEYACRARMVTALNNGRNLTSVESCSHLDSVGWYDKNSGGKTHPVGRKRPNNWGLYDMHGNVWEWCRDWRGTYPQGDVTDPLGIEYGSNRVYRGGSWYNSARDCRSATRNSNFPDHCHLSLGFRLAFTIVQ